MNYSTWIKIVVIALLTTVVLTIWNVYEIRWEPLQITERAVRPIQLPPVNSN